jgi:hypothetical protein
MRFIAKRFMSVVFSAGLFVVVVSSASSGSTPVRPAQTASAATVTSAAVVIDRDRPADCQHPQSPARPPRH